MFHTSAKKNGKKYRSSRSFFGGTAYIVDHDPRENPKLSGDFFGAPLIEELGKKMSSQDLQRAIGVLGANEDFVRISSECLIHSAATSSLYAEEDTNTQQLKLFESELRGQVPEFRAATDIVGVCGADSGGPVMQYSKRGNIPILVGISSRFSRGEEWSVQKEAQHQMSRLKTSCAPMSSHIGDTRLTFANVFAYNAWISGARQLMEQGRFTPSKFFGQPWSLLSSDAQGSAGEGS